MYMHMYMWMNARDSKRQRPLRGCDHSDERAKGAKRVTADSLFTSILILFLMLAAVISTIAASHWRMTRALGATMFGLYGVFVMQDLLFQFCSFRLPDSWKPCSKCG